MTRKEAVVLVGLLIQGLGKPTAFQLDYNAQRPSSLAMSARVAVQPHVEGHAATASAPRGEEEDDSETSLHIHPAKKDRIWSLRFNQKCVCGGGVGATQPALATMLLEEQDAGGQETCLPLISKGQQIHSPVVLPGRNC